jgi:F-type H+-transporting ATP synthase subunit e
VFYGIWHRRTLQKTHDEEKVHHAKHERQDLVARAKEAWKKQQEASKGGGESWSTLPASICLWFTPAPVVTDPEDPRFDLEKLIASLEAQS